MREHVFHLQDTLLVTDSRQQPKIIAPRIEDGHYQPVLTLAEKDAVGGWIGFPDVHQASPVRRLSNLVPCFEPPADLRMFPARPRQCDGVEDFHTSHYVNNEPKSQVKGCQYR